MAPAAGPRTDGVTASPSSRRRDRFLTVVAAGMVGLVTWAIAGPLLDIHLAVNRGGSSTEATEIGLGAVLITSILAALAAWGLLALLERFTTRSRTAWTVVAVVVLLLSLMSPLSGGISTAAKVALLAMHVLVGGVIIVLSRHRSTAR